MASYYRSLPGSTMRQMLRRALQAAARLGRYFKSVRPGLTGIETIFACTYGIPILKMLLHFYFRLKNKKGESMLIILTILNDKCGNFGRIYAMHFI